GPVMITYTTQDPDTPGIPLATEISGVFPNPFNPATTIRYSVTVSSPVRIDVYNLRGQMVTRLIDTPHHAGHYRVVWNGQDSNGNNCTTGIYLIRMTAGNKTSLKKVVLSK
ncbi:MAG: T9SS type A sorting domain-containing protein, partial [Candidatus Cloacimonetes bacterium]|nr:T9SS type A sorting domain-containing protein [Candidatus Cloacimonadota bacterium]